MKIWIVFTHPNGSPLAVFSTRDRAKEYTRRYKIRWDELAYTVECSVDTETLPELSPAEQLLGAMGYTERKEE